MFEYDGEEFEKPYDFVTKILQKNIKCNDIVLELGCGNAKYKKSIEECGAKYIGLDLTDEDYKPGVKRNVDIVSDACNLKDFEDSSIDIIYTVGAFYHFPGKDICLKEYKRVLKNKGKIVFFEYTSSVLSNLSNNYYSKIMDDRNSFEYMRHVDVYDYKYIKNLLDNNSFSNIYQIKLFSNSMKNRVKEYIRNLFIKDWYEKNKTWNIIIGTNEGNI